jgi:hypothetical protein
MFTENLSHFCQALSKSTRYLNPKHKIYQNIPKKLREQDKNARAYDCTHVHIGWRYNTGCEASVSAH